MTVTTDLGRKREKQTVTVCFDDNDLQGVNLKTGKGALWSFRKKNAFLLATAALKMSIISLMLCFRGTYICPCTLYTAFKTLFCITYGDNSFSIIDYSFLSAAF